ncbi:MAG: hypothetical protein AAF411_24840, partial [Myxococcota bacterium]
MKNASKKRLRRHQRNNARLAGEWDRYAPHRRRVMALLAALLHGKSRIALLGAGNGNDVDLRALIERDHELHLFDLDAAALARAKARAPGV